MEIARQKNTPYRAICEFEVSNASEGALAARICQNGGVSAGTGERYLATAGMERSAMTGEHSSSPHKNTYSNHREKDNDPNKKHEHKEYEAKNITPEGNAGISSSGFVATSIQVGSA